MSSPSSTLFDNDPVLEAALDRVIAVLGGHLVEDTAPADPTAVGDQQPGQR